MPRCVVPGCTHNNGFQFPTDPQLRERWRGLVKRSDPNKPSKLWDLDSHLMPVICHHHFREEDFQTHSSTTGDKMNSNY